MTYLLSWLSPNWLYYSIAGFCTAGIIVLNVISFNMTLIHRFLVILLSALLFGVFLSYSRHSDLAWQERINKEQQEIVILQAKAKEITNEVVIQYVDRIKIVEGKSHVIIKKIPEYITKEADANCAITNGFIELHDSAAKNTIPDSTRNPDEVSTTVKLSTVANTVAINYNTYHKVVEQLKALQDWIIKQKDLNNV
jgi:hypothetical protein